MLASARDVQNVENVCVVPRDEGGASMQIFSIDFPKIWHMCYTYVRKHEKKLGVTDLFRCYGNKHELISLISKEEHILIKILFIAHQTTHQMDESSPQGF